MLLLPVILTTLSLLSHLISPKDPWSASFFLKSDTDVIMAIEETKTTIPITKWFHWIKGHQDNDMNIPFEGLPWSAKLNILADEQATAALIKVQNQRTYPPKMLHLPACPIYLLAQGREQTSHKRNTLRTDIGRDQMEKYIMKRNKWSFSDLKTVAWHPYEQAMNRLTDRERVFIVRLSHRWLAVGKKQAQMGAENDKCVLCSLTEDTDHLFQCPQRNKWRTEFLTALKAELTILDTAAETRNTIVNSVGQWMNMQPVNESPQDVLGWGAFINGYISTHWVEQQDSFYNERGRHDYRRHNGNY